jgi:cholesterol oxidase
MADTQINWLAQGLEVLLEEIARAPGSEGEPHFDIVIIGSGYGGAIAASRLAGTKNDAGAPLRIAVLERGKEYLPGMFPSGLSTLAGHARFTNPWGKEPVGRREGLFDIRMGADINALVANGLGGGSLINAGVMEKPTPEVFDQRWPTQLRGGTKLDTLYDSVKERLGAGNELKPNTVDLHPKLKNVPLAKYRALRKLKRDEFRAAAITVAMSNGPNNSKVQMSACKLCGDCATGCNFGAKDSLDVNLLVEAKRRNVRLFTEATVLSIAGKDGAWTIEVIHTQPPLAKRAGQPARITAARVILAAGAFGSTEILLRSRAQGLKVSNDEQLGARFSGNGDMLAVGFGQNDPVNAVADETQAYDTRRIGPTITGVIDLRENNENNKPPLVIEEMAVPGPMRRVFEELFTTAATLHDMATADTSRHRAGSLQEDPLAVNSKTIQHSAIYAVMGDDGATGRIARRSDFEPNCDGSVTVQWKDLGKQALFPTQISTLENLLTASDSGGRVIPNPLWRPLPSTLSSLIAAPTGPLVTVHPLGGCAMGDDAGKGVVNHLGQVFTGNVASPTEVYRTLAVLDGSIIPSALGTNPALTIAVVAQRAVNELFKEWRLLEPDPAAPPGFGKRPVFREVCPPEPALPTTMKFVERLRGKVYLDTGRRTKPYHAEITLYFDDKKLSELYACDDDEKGTAHTLTVATRRAPPNMISRLRLFDQDDWDDVYARGLFGREQEEALEELSLLTAPLTGRLTILGRQPTRHLQRVGTAFAAWLVNRGGRDSWQSKFPRNHELPAGGVDASTDATANDPGLLEILLRVCSRAGEVRLFEYDLTVGKPVKDTLKLVRGKNSAIRATKHITYRHRSNPLDQLSMATVSEFPGLSRQGEPPVLRLVPEFLARKGLPLFRIAQEQDAPQAIADLLSLGTYFVRLLISIHLLTFRKPDAAPPREFDRLPRDLPGLPPCAVAEVPVLEEVDGELQHAGHILLTRYRGRGNSSLPVMLIHGYSASGTTFAHPSLKIDLARHLWQQGRDVWVLDMRSSCGMEKTATVNYSFEQLAATDIPIAVDHICKATGKASIDIVAHCMGAAMLSMAVLDPDSTVAGPHYEAQRKALPGRIRRAVLSQVGPLVTIAPRNIFLAYLLSYLKYYLPLQDYRFSPDVSDSLFSELLDRILSATPYPEHEFDLENPKTPWKRTPWVRARHRMDLLYGRTFSLANMSDEALQHLDDFFGPMSVETATQVVHFAKYQSITNRVGFNDYASRARLRRHWCFPTFSIHGRKNGLADVSTLRRMETILKDAGCDYRSRPFDHYGHQDCLIGKNPLAIFQAIENFLAEQGPAICPVPEPGPMLAQVPWSGPVIWPLQSAQVDGVMLPVSFGYNPALSKPEYVVAIPLGKGPDGFELLRNAASDPLCQVYPAPAFEHGWGKMLLALRGAQGAHSLLLLLVYDEPAALDNALFGLAEPLFDGASIASVLAAPGGPASSLAGLPKDRIPALAAAVETCLTEDRHNIEAGMVRIPQQRRPGRLRIAMGSCQYPPGIIDHEPGFHSYHRLAKHIGESTQENRIDLVLLLGDQVYVDPTAGLADPQSPEERFLFPYQNWYRSREVRNVLRQVPAYMVMDDHEVADNWEPLRAPDRKHDEALALGLKYYLNFQCGPLPPGKSFTPDFVHNGFHFFVADTRTKREHRDAQNVGNRNLLGTRQSAALDAWLQARATEDPARPKFIVSPAMFAPRLRKAMQGAKTANAIHGDGWDGYPASFLHIVRKVHELKLQNLYMLSGDAHLSCKATITVQADGQAPLHFWSVHASALFAPYPFANTQPDELMARESFSLKDDAGVKLADCRVETEFAPPGNGFAFLEAVFVQDQWQVEISYDRKVTE